MPVFGSVTTIAAAPDSTVMAPLLLKPSKSVQLAIPVPVSDTGTLKIVVDPADTEVGKIVPTEGGVESPPCAAVTNTPELGPELKLPELSRQNTNTVNTPDWAKV